MLQVYAIKNCNTVKKALKWLEENECNYTFHDYKKEPVTEEKLEEWETKTNWENLINKKGTTWRKLDKSIQEIIVDAKSANKILLSNNSMIKRPIIEYKDGVLIGFDENKYRLTLL